MATKYSFLIVCTLFISNNLTFGQSATQTNSETERKKILFIAGPDSHGKGEHEYNGGLTFLARKLKEGMPEIDTAVYHNGWPKEEAALQNASTIVLFCDGAEGHLLIPHLSEVESLMNKGTGFVVLHFTMELPKGTDADRFRDLVGGYFETHWSVNPFWTPDIEKLPNHPITNGVKPFAIRDEWYYHMRFVENEKNITPILKVLPPDSTLTRPEGSHTNNAYVREAVLKNKESQTIAWTYNRPKGGRSFGFTGGHVHNNWQNDNFRMLVLNAIVWTANGKVPSNGIVTKTPELKELEVLTKPGK
ncbi:ThuA domain-containing protein [Dyadobacter sp. CY345]|uniref:ThuA domain-containing protein n=1 Tax=Dyadobacter sp. CY345 TaxID=2909335 RepID=UPI001F1BD24B|nr:ThuA domain-containing protein [Dyadobacter sp. CY345]MCF2446978.1 ThuA domain-containing protein [Dyadobacter sp. CY345]